MLTLHTFGPALGVPDSSPFCMKLEAFLVMAGIPFERRQITSLREAPKGKGPWIEENGRKIGDSALIIRHLEADRGVDLDAGLSPAERAAAHALAVMLEERTYFALMSEHCMVEANWAVMRDEILDGLPEALKEHIRTDHIATLKGQGLGRHTREERMALAKADIDALSAWLGTKPFMMGERPTKLDATASAFVIDLGIDAFDTPIKAMIDSHPNLVDYGQRCLARFFPTFGAPAEAA